MVGIFQTNAYPLGFTDITASTGGAKEAGVFLLCSRLNSSCVPNVNNHYNEAMGALCIYALRDIEEGEELCVCYNSVFGCREERQRSLFEKFRFNCTCETCQLEGGALEKSDERREMLGRLYLEIPKEAKNPAYRVQLVRPPFS